jgi:hypothetical protein
MSKPNVIPAESNEHALALVKDLNLAWSKEIGDYQGQVLVALTDDKKVYLYDISYGSCGGCDWFESYYDEPIPYKDAVDEYGDWQPVYIFPKTFLPDAVTLYELFYADGYQDYNKEYGWDEQTAAELLKAVTELTTPTKGDE